MEFLIVIAKCQLTWNTLELEFFQFKKSPQYEIIDILYYFLNNRTKPQNAFIYELINFHTYKFTGIK